MLTFSHETAPGLVGNTVRVGRHMAYERAETISGFDPQPVSRPVEQKDL